LKCSEKQPDRLLLRDQALISASPEQGDFRDNREFRPGI
jgi:hypothetical protein